jgi:hypothetical protein
MWPKAGVLLMCVGLSGCIPRPMLVTVEPTPVRLAIVVDQTGGGVDLASEINDLVRAGGRKAAGLPRGSRLYFVPVREDKLHAVGQTLRYPLPSEDERKAGDWDLVQLSEKMRREIPQWLKDHGPATNAYTQSDIRGAVDLAREQLGKAGRRVLIVLSDGLDTAKGLDPKASFEGIEVEFVSLRTTDLEQKSQAARLRVKEKWMALLTGLGAQVNWHDNGISAFREVLSELAR